MNIPKNYRNPQSFRNIEKQAQKFSELAYLEARQPKHLQNQAFMDCYYKEAKRLTKTLEDAGYWKKSIISIG